MVKVFEFLKASFHLITMFRSSWYQTFHYQSEISAFTWFSDNSQKTSSLDEGRNCGTTFIQWNLSFIMYAFSLSSMVLATWLAAPPILWARGQKSILTALLYSFMSFSSTYFDEDDELDADLLSDLTYCEQTESFHLSYFNVSCLQFFGNNSFE